MRKRVSDWSNCEDTLRPGVGISFVSCTIHIFSRPERILEDGDKSFDGRVLGLFLETSSKPCLVLLSHIVRCHSIDQSDHKQTSHSIPTHSMPRSWSRPSHAVITPAWICSKETEQCKKRQTCLSTGHIIEIETHSDKYASSKRGNRTQDACYTTGKGEKKEEEKEK
jgi:hypothetical protein